MIPRYLQLLTLLIVNDKDMSGLDLAFEENII